MSDPELAMVYVDDADPGIEYGGSWVAVENVGVELSSVLYPESIHSPWYGTLHTTNGNASLTYSFNVFVDTVSIHGRFLFNNFMCNRQHSAQSHLGIRRHGVAFDGIMYKPSGLPTWGVDIAYNWGVTPATPNTQLDLPGDDLVLQFNDDQPRINFSISNPSSSSGASFFWQPLVQTPPLPSGPHILHISLLGTETNVNSTGIRPLHIIVQNTTRPTTLATIPAEILKSAIFNTSVPVPSSTASSASSEIISNKDHLSRKQVIGVAAGTCLTLVALLCIRSVTPRPTLPLQLPSAQSTLLAGGRHITRLYASLRFGPRMKKRYRNDTWKESLTEKASRMLENAGEGQECRESEIEK
ncbi:hypothetical protein CPC08DRAFT_753822 [Agrocybe pediades]|nr:hypothetical protein CPC08DRAFT_753822 [Agrocybe pediades]